MRRAFTLIELLVVIAIIAILAAILFPVFAQAREKARSTNCLSNTKQIGMSFRMYVEDTDGKYPMAYTEWSAQVGDNFGELYGGHAGVGNEAQAEFARKASYVAQLMPYSKSAKIFVCPSDSGVGTQFGVGSQFTSYHYRHYLSSTYSPGPRGGAYHIGGWLWTDSRLESPAGMFVFHENSVFHQPKQEYLEWLSGFGSDAERKGWAPNTTMNFVFGDGHAKTHAVGTILCRAAWWPRVGWDYHWPRRHWEGKGWNADGTPTPDID